MIFEGFWKPRFRSLRMTPARWSLRFNSDIAKSGDVRPSMSTLNFVRTPPSSDVRRCCRGGAKADADAERRPKAARSMSL